MTPLKKFIPKSKSQSIAVNLKLCWILDASCSPTNSFQLGTKCADSRKKNSHELLALPQLLWTRKRVVIHSAIHGPWSSILNQKQQKLRSEKFAWTVVCICQQSTSHCAVQSCAVQVLGFVSHDWTTSDRLSRLKLDSPVTDQLHGEFFFRLIPSSHSQLLSNSSASVFWPKSLETEASKWKLLGVRKRKHFWEVKQKEFLLEIRNQNNWHFGRQDGACQHNDVENFEFQAFVQASNCSRTK